MHSVPPGAAGGERFDVAWLERALAGTTLGHPLLYFRDIGSTNTEAVALARTGTAEGTLLLTDHQTAGRGRIGRVWQSLPGQQLQFSLILHPTFPPHFLVMASALAVVEAIRVETGLDAAIKWPNDVLIGGRKVAGILIEASGGAVVLGIGVNVNSTLAGWPELAARATTLADATGSQVIREALAAAILTRLDASYADLQQRGEVAQQAIRAAWRGQLETLGRAVVIHQNGGEVRGVAEDVDAGGELIVREANGTRQIITWGDVE